MLSLGKNAFRSWGEGLLQLAEKAWIRPILPPPPRFLSVWVTVTQVRSCNPHLLSHQGKRRHFTPHRSLSFCVLVHVWWILKSSCLGGKKEHKTTGTVIGDLGFVFSHASVTFLWISICFQEPNNRKQTALVVSCAGRFPRFTDSNETTGREWIKH